MNFITKKIKSLIGPGTKGRTNDPTPLDFVKSRKSILRELIISKKSGNLIGIYSKALGEGMFLTGVEEIEPMSKDGIIVLNQNDISGKVLPRTRLDLDEIQMICPFNKPYRNPLLSTSKTEKSNGLFGPETLMA